MRNFFFALVLAGLFACSAPAPRAAASGATSEVDGGLRERARGFLARHMGERDRASLSREFLDENLEFALRARAEFPWAAAVPEELFLNDVLPYAVFDEPRDPWRAEMYVLAGRIVRGATSAGEAAQWLNRDLFRAIGVHYETGRERANQSLRESRASGKASCTGLSIALVQACRAVGIPARAVGTPRWATKPGNHTWVEVWDGKWHFLGADEYDPAGLDRGWFVADASHARADSPRHRIYATSWRRGDTSFPMAWSAGDDSVAAVDVTARYAKPEVAAAAGTLFLRVLRTRDGERMVVVAELCDDEGRAVQRASTRAGQADWNDMASFALGTHARPSLRLVHAGEVRVHALQLAGDGPWNLELCWEDLPVKAEALHAPGSDEAVLRAVKEWLASDPATRGDPPARALTRSQAQGVLELFVEARRAELALQRSAELDARSIELGGQTLRWLEKPFGEAPEGRRSLWISLHGGGGAPSEVNDRQWRNQIELYQPAEGFYVAPRAPTNTWNLWHEAHVDALFARLIEDYVALRGVDPARVYLLGYSAGGDGVWQLAPRMADRFAAAAMMAGHPNEASLLSLRNLPFAILMGADDAAYDRNKVARERAARLGELRAADPSGYEHFTRFYEGLGHWMQRKDAEVLPWMAERTRVDWPRKLVWFQDDVVHARSYWLRRPIDEARAGERIDAEIDGQTIRITAPGVKAGALELADSLLDLDRPIVVEIDGKRVFQGLVERRAATIWSSLRERFDPRQVASARVEWKVD